MIYLSSVSISLGEIIDGMQFIFWSIFQAYVVIKSHQSYPLGNKVPAHRITVKIYKSSWTALQKFAVIILKLNSVSCDMTKPTKWVCAQWRLRSDWASAQSDLSLHCAHTHFVGFVMLRLMWFYSKVSYGRARSAAEGAFWSGSALFGQTFPLSGSLW